MARVVGIGGFFVRCDDPKATARWYREVLGVDFASDSTFAALEQPAASTSVLALFDRSSDYLGAPDQQSMCNLVVDDLDALVTHARALGVEPEPIVDSEQGRFSWVVDPEGRRLELWQPPAS